MNHSMRKADVLRIAFGVLGVLVLIAAWTFLSYVINSEIILPSPADVAKSFVSLCLTHDFRVSVARTLLSSLIGYTAGIFFGILFAVPYAKNRCASAFLSPFGTIIRSVPVASFSLLALIWIKAAIIPSAVAAIAVAPIVCSATKSGLLEISPELDELAHAYGFSFFKRMRLVVLPAVAPHLASACVTALGFSFKATITAEILCKPKYSIGSGISDAKSGLLTSEMFAWTLTVVILSLIIERTVRFIAKGRGKNI